MVGRAEEHDEVDQGEEEHEDAGDGARGGVRPVGLGQCCTQIGLPKLLRLKLTVGFMIRRKIVLL